MLKWIILEILFNMLICPPYLDFNWQMQQDEGTLHLSLNGIFFGLVLLRPYLILRLYQQYSRWTNDEAIAAW